MELGSGMRERLFSRIVTFAVCALTSASLYAQEGSNSGSTQELTGLNVTVLAKGTSSKATQAETMRELPLDRLNPEQRQLADKILKKQSLYRHLPTIEFETHPHVYSFFASHPDVAVSIWRAMKISDFKMWQTGEVSYEADAGDGSVGAMQVMFRTPEQQLVYCSGVYKTPLLPKPIKARTLLYLRTSYQQGNGGRTKVVHRADLFVELPSQSVETAAKVISPLSNMIADRNFREVSMFVHMMSEAMVRQPGWVERIADRLDGVLKVRKTQLVELTEKVNQSARVRRATGEENVSSAAVPTGPQVVGDGQSTATQVSATVSR